MIGLLCERAQPAKRAREGKMERRSVAYGQRAEVRLRKEIQELGLESHIADLETDGYTVLPPGKAAPIELFDELVSVMGDLSTKLPTDNLEGNGLGKTLFHMLPEHRAFERALMASVPLTCHLSAWLSCQVKSVYGLIKDRGTSPRNTCRP